MLAIGKKIKKNVNSGTEASKRRLFFMQLAGGIIGGWAAGNFFLAKRLSLGASENKKNIEVTIHPQAVARRAKKDLSHGE